MGEKVSRLAYEASSSKNTYRIYVIPTGVEDEVCVSIHKKIDDEGFFPYLTLRRGKYTEGPYYQHTTTIYPNRVWWKPWTWRNIGLQEALNKMIECIDDFIERENNLSQRIERTLRLVDSSAELIESNIRTELDKKYSTT